MSDLTARAVHLRLYSLEDADWLAVLLNDPDVTAMTSSIPFPYARSDAEAFLSRVRSESGRKISRAVVAEDGQLVGGIGFGPRPGDVEEVGYWIGKPYWGRGYATRALGQFLALLKSEGFEGPLQAQTARNNPASQKVLLANGFVHVGQGECITPARETSKMASERFVLEAL